MTTHAFETIPDPFRTQPDQSFLPRDTVGHAWPPFGPDEPTVVTPQQRHLGPEAFAPTRVSMRLEYDDAATLIDEPLFYDDCYTLELELRDLLPVDASTAEARPERRDEVGIDPDDVATVVAVRKVESSADVASPADAAPQQAPGITASRPRMLPARTAVVRQRDQGFGGRLLRLLKR